MYYKSNFDSSYTEEQLKQTRFFALYKKSNGLPRQANS